MQRQFTSGSRQAPDPFDQFLEEHDFYRKHTARDSSCLFRVISEQMYDTQLHHLSIREKCVTYMRKHHKYFDYLVNRDFDEYLDDMSKPKTYGTLLELQAAGYMFERNVLLFQPFNLGNYYNEYRVNFEEVFRVFYTPERHFDSVFTSDYIQEAAICQSICYEILYKDLFKLPDVTFAVEQMLHGPSFENMEYSTETNEQGYATCIHLSDGRSFELDLPNNTNCILENYKLCHFHYVYFPRYSSDLQRELKNANCDEYEKNSMLIQRTAESFLPNKYVSCVRQLLQEGITPFPYKVAKALDSNMYRNIEFDSWNEMRKELKLQNWYNGDTNFKLIRYSTRRVRKIFQVGAKCHVKLRKSEQDLYTCHIQEIAVDEGQCIVFIEQLGEKRLVPYENLSPLPPEQFKPWTVPYRLQRHMQKYSSVRFTRHYNYRFKLNTTNENYHQQHNEFSCGSISDNDNCSNSNYIDDDPKKFAHQHSNQHCHTPSPYFKLKQYAHLEDFRTHVEYCTMPLTVTHSGCEGDGLKGGNQQERSVDSFENSRTPSRSSTARNRIATNTAGYNKSNANSVSNNVDDHFGGDVQTFDVAQIDNYDTDYYNNPGIGTVYVPESFYPMYPYPTPNGLVDDYYGYCSYDAGIPSGAAYMPAAVNGMNGYYYVCNNAISPQGNYFNTTSPYLPPPPSQQFVGIPQPSPILTSCNPPNPSYNSNATFVSGVGGLHSTSNSPATSGSTNMPPPINNTTNPARLANSSNMSTNTPINERINYDAQKSVKVNGVDLPNDIATLRFFYNLGWDCYHKQKSNNMEQTSIESSNDQAKISSNDTQNNVKLDYNADQITNTKSSDIQNNKVIVLETNVSNTCETKQVSSQLNKTHSNGTASNLSNSCNNKNHNRRYSSRYFNGKDRQILSHRNSSNYNMHNMKGGQQQQQQIYSQRNQHNYNKYSSNNHCSTVSSSSNTGRNGQQRHLQPTYNTCAASEQYYQMSPTYCNEASSRSNSAEPQNCQTPITNSLNSNNSTITVYANCTEQTNNCGNSSAGNLPISLQSTASGVFVPIPLTTGGPPPPYGVFAPHASSGTPQATAGVGIHPSYIPGPAPHLIAHCSLPPPPTTSMHGTYNSAGPGSTDNTDNGCGSEMIINNTGAGGILGMGSPTGMQFQCPNYPPPPMPFYYSANCVNSTSGSGGSVAGGTLTASASGVQLISPFPHQVAGSTSANQTAFASQHPTMGNTQGFYCLQPPPPASMPPQQVAPQAITQTTSPSLVQPNRNSNANSLTQDNISNVCSHNDLVTVNKE